MIALAFTCLLTSSLASTEEAVVVSARPVVLHRAPVTGPERLGALAYTGGLELDSADPRFGGLSGMILIRGGAALLTVSDNGRLFLLPLLRDEAGRLTGIGAASTFPIETPEGALGRGEGDSEELQLLPDGRLLVSFEQHHRLATIGRLDSLGTMVEAPFPSPKGLQLAPKNGGLEAMLALPSGQVFVIREKPLDHLGKHAAWLITERPEKTEPLTYRTTEGYQPTALAASGSSVLALERRYTVLSGISARVMRFPASVIAAGAEVKTSEVATFAPEHICDNFEAMASEPTAAGTRLLIASDDNFNPGQHTYLLEFVDTGK